MPCGLPSVGRQSYICFKLQRDKHTLLVEFKASLKLKSGDTLACYLLTSSRQDSQIEESIAGRCMKVKLSVHGTSNMLYMVFHVRKLLTHYVRIYTKMLKQLHKQCIAPLTIHIYSIHT